MKLLLDTHAFLWWIAGSDLLGPGARAVIEERANECVVSLASCWEIAIKLSLGKLRVDADLDSFLPEQLAANGFRLLLTELRHTARVARLPFHHPDPFDRLLVAQALEERLALVSCDEVFEAYGVERVW